MYKKRYRNVLIRTRAGEAKPVPPLGPALGQLNLNMADFCNTINELTSKFDPSLRVKATMIYDRVTFLSWFVRVTPEIGQLFSGFVETNNDGIRVISISNVYRVIVFWILWPFHKNVHSRSVLFNYLTEDLISEESVNSFILSSLDRTVLFGFLSTLRSLGITIDFNEPTH